jgi:RNA polymerase sigma-70 factor (ECF subfamily)
MLMASPAGATLDTVLPMVRRLDPDRLGDHVDRLYRAAVSLCGDRHDAEDLVQDTYARVLARPRWLRSEDEVGYLLRVLRNTHVSRLRARDRRPVGVPLDEERLVDGDRAPGHRDEIALEATELLEAIAALPPDARDVIIAVDVVGLSYREAGRALRVKEATVTTRLHRARARLARALNPDPADRPGSVKP